MTAQFNGTARFQVIRQLGEGGMGAVYEVYDRELNVRTALKTLLKAEPSSLLRFKNEFRSFQDLAHPNLVSLGELFHENGVWFFTMELLDGVTFVQHIRQGSLPALDQISENADTLPLNSKTLVQQAFHESYGGSFDAAALRRTLKQLVRGLTALHRADKVHRDIKPSNVLVTLAEERVVLLDYGIATDISGYGHLTNTSAIGTPLYMAPEQSAKKPVDSAADFYSVGIMLYECLTGQVPFENMTIGKLLFNKQNHVPPPPSLLVSDVPDDLNEITMNLLAIDPKKRYNAHDILEQLGSGGSITDIRERPLFVATTKSNPPPFVGRGHDLYRLHEVFDLVRTSKSAKLVYIYGEPGVGKSALVERFTKQAKTKDNRTVVLSGKCYEHKTVPYNAVDGIVDELSRYMSRLAPEGAAALLPRHVAILTQMFPVLNRVETIAEATAGVVQSSNSDDSIRRAYAAFRETITRMSDRAPVVLIVHDLQWADTQSINLLSELMKSPDSPAVELICTIRTTSAGEGSESPIPTVTDPTIIRLPRLNAEESYELAKLLLARSKQDVQVELNAIVRESGGHPLFIDELLRHKLAAAREGAPEAPPDLEEALWERIQRLKSGARRMLTVLACSPVPLRESAAALASEVKGQQIEQIVKELKAVHLVRSATSASASDSYFIEPYHDRVRHTIQSHLSPTEVTEMNRKLATLLESLGHNNPETLAIIWKSANNSERVNYYLSLARKPSPKRKE